MKTIQTELFAEPKPEKPATFHSLPLHQKINHKANKGMFAVYLSRYNYYHSPIHKPKADSLSADYYEHYVLNAGNGNRLDRWRRENKKSMF